MAEPLSDPASTARRSAHEAARLEALRRYNILDTPPEATFDRITNLAARLFGMPIALISLIDESRGWFKSAHGFDIQEVQRNDTICSLALLSNEVLVIADTRQDERLACNPFVQSEPGLRFYAGAPLITEDGFVLGTLCLLDTQPHAPLTDEQQTVLSNLAALVIDELELRLAARKIAQIDTALLEVTRGVSRSVGDAFFAALVQHFTQTLAVDYTYIGLLHGNSQNTIQTIAACARGQIIDNFEYRLQDTPCQQVLESRKLCCYANGVQVKFPQAPLLAPLGIESYAAMPFFDSSGTAIGLLGIMDSKPLVNLQLTETLLTIFALRVATELERQQTEAARQRALTQLVDQQTVELTQTNQLLHLEIADRQQAETALQKEQDVLRVLLDSVQAGIVACNAEGVLTLFNQAAREFHGMPEQPLPPEQWAESYDLYRPDGQTPLPTAEIPLFRALQGETVSNAEMVIAPKTGPARTLLVNGQAIVDGQGKRQGAVVVMHDITERKQAEAMRLRLVEDRAQLVRAQAARLEAETEQRRSTFLVEVSAALAASLDYEQTLQIVAQLAVPYFADWCAVDLLNEDGSISRVAVAHCDPQKVQLGWEMAERFPRHLDDGYGISQVMKTGQSEIVVTITDEQMVATVTNPEYLEILRGAGLRSFVVAPLQARGRVLGSISFVFAESERHYDPSDLALAEDLGRRAAIAIDNARLYQAAQQAQQAAETAADRTARLQTVTAALSESLTPVQVAAVIVEQSVAALEADAALMALLSSDGTTLEIVQSTGYSVDPKEIQPRFSIDAPLPLSEAVKSGQPAWSEPMAERLARYPHLADAYKKQPFEAWISLPLMVEGKAVGGLSLSFKQFKQLSQDDREFMLTLSRQCAQAISRSQLYEAERQARAEAEQANQIKDEFLAVLSHELRSPLNPILGWSQILQKQQHDPATQTRGLQTIERNARLQTQLIDDLLDMSKILQGKLSLEAAPINLQSVIEAALETVRLAAEAKAIAIQVNCAPVGYVSGDAGRLQQVVWNLLSNAVKFTDHGGRVAVSLEQGEASTSSEVADPMQISTPQSQPLQGYAQITVTDTGKGLTDEVLPYIFDRFRQADSTTTRQFGGLGLGLAIVRQLVELHGGTVQAESAGDGQGSTFRVKLPLLSAAGLGPADTPRPEALGSSAMPLAGFRVLAVDDEADSREMLAFILEQAGARVTAAGSAVEALQALNQSPFDVVISDIGMPGMDGYMLLQHMAAQFAEPGRVAAYSLPKAIALTAYAGEINQQKALAVGFQRHFSKPVEPAELVAAIASLID
ncbi:GAF domain-containing protein [Nodosilinea sp. FACHB-13]|uniref:GAF domain-containing protein n=1 Tax=Cyanophyceae TaxID=3028117 RepID=UPI001682EFEC|nr:GAF domain-containing protein [Nodosilinea sp. FACHB-13]MBD2108620.1 GAF domain-containing protein [Nodosilinea sp. FACHB-13]